MKESYRAALRIVAALILSMCTARAEIVDRIVAVVGDRAIAWSAAYEEANYEAFRKHAEPPSASVAGPLSQELRTVLGVLIDQALLQQQLSRSPVALSGSEDIESRLAEIASEYPSPEAYREALVRYHLSEEQLIARLTRESFMLAFVDAALRPQVRVVPEDVDTYYRDVFVPELRAARSGAEAPPIEEVRGQIEEILTQQQINRLLDEWLQQLRRSTRIERWPE